MRPWKYRLGLLFVFLLATSAGAGPAEQGMVQDRAVAERYQGEVLEKLVYDTLKKHGSVTHPDFPYLLYAKRVRGRTIQFVELVRRDEEGRGYEWVGTALEMELNVDLPQRKLCVRWRDLQLLTADGSRAYSAEREWERELPSEPNFLRFRPTKAPDRASLNLFPEAVKFFDQKLYLSAKARLLEQAFGPECEELLLDHKVASKSGLVMASSRCQVRPGDQVWLSSLSLARFGKHPGKGDRPSWTARYHDALLSVTDYSNLLASWTAPPEWRHGKITIDVQGRRIVLDLDRP